MPAKLARDMNVSGFSGGRKADVADESWRYLQLRKARPIESTHDLGITTYYCYYSTS